MGGELVATGLGPRAESPVLANVCGNRTVSGIVGMAGATPLRSLAIKFRFLQGSHYTALFAVNGQGDRHGETLGVRQAGPERDQVTDSNFLEVFFFFFAVIVAGKIKAEIGGPH